METTALLGLVQQLDGNLGQLEDALGPILEDSLNATSKKLPLLERAKLNITVVYAIESLIFSYLKVNGTDPRNHPVFTEIERVKRYFGKIKEAEETPNVKPSITLNKQAAARIIQHSLAGNGPTDLAQREREAKERLMQKRKLKAESTTPVEIGKPVSIGTPSTPSIEVEVPPPPMHTNPNTDIHESSAEEGEINDDEPSVPLSETPEQRIVTKQPQTKKRKQKHSSDGPSKLSADRKADKRARKKAKKAAKSAANGPGNAG